MVDIHHHLLWGVDDGARDLQTSVAMARASAADGITHIVCTPHANAQFPFDPALNTSRLEQLNACLLAENIPLTLGLGSDFHLSYDNIQEAKQHPSRFSVNRLSYLMVEIPDYGIPPNLSETFYELQLAGLTPILTHPERNPTLQADHSRLAEWMRGGVLVQVTADSVTGKMGRSAAKLAHQLLSKRWVHFLATDAHGINSRPPRLAEAHTAVSRKYGTAYADSLVEHNPMSVFEGKPFDPVEEPQDLYETFKDRPWWKRLLD